MSELGYIMLSFSKNIWMAHISLSLWRCERDTSTILEIVACREN